MSLDILSVSIFISSKLIVSSRLNVCLVILLLSSLCLVLIRDPISLWLQVLMICLDGVLINFFFVSSIRFLCCFSSSIIDIARARIFPPPNPLDPCLWIISRKNVFHYWKYKFPLFKSLMDLLTLPRMKYFPIIIWYLFLIFFV